MNFVIYSHCCVFFFCLGKGDSRPLYRGTNLWKTRRRRGHKITKRNSLIFLSVNKYPLSDMKKRLCHCDRLIVVCRVWFISKKYRRPANVGSYWQIKPDNGLISLNMSLILLHRSFPVSACGCVCETNKNHLCYQSRLLK